MLLQEGKAPSDSSLLRVVFPDSSAFLLTISSADSTGGQARDEMGILAGIP